MRGAWRDMVFEPKYEFPAIAIGKPRKDIFTIHPLTCALEGMRDMQEYVSIFCGDTTSESAWGKRIAGHTLLIIACETSNILTITGRYSNL